MIIALALATSASAGSGQSAVSAFECNLPYEQAMQSMASLKVKQERGPDIFERTLDAIGIIEFETEGVSIFGNSPSSLTLTIFEPRTDPRFNLPKTFKAKYVSKFPTSKAVDSSIVSAVKWSEPGCTTQGVCGAHKRPNNLGGIIYKRTSSEFLEFECSVTIRQDEL